MRNFTKEAKLLAIIVFCYSDWLSTNQFPKIYLMQMDFSYFYTEI